MKLKKTLAIFCAVLLPTMVLAADDSRDTWQTQIDVLIRTFEKVVEDHCPPTITTADSTLMKECADATKKKDETIGELKNALANLGRIQPEFTTASTNANVDNVNTADNAIKTGPCKGKTGNWVVQGDFCVCPEQYSKMDEKGGVETGDGTYCGMDQAKIAKAQEAYTDARENERSLANRALGGLGTGLTGYGMSELARGLAEQATDKQSAANIKELTDSFHCLVQGRAAVIKGGASGQAPDYPQNFIPLISQYDERAREVAILKEQLGMPPGIESEAKIDTSRLYEGGSLYTVSPGTTAQERLDSGDAKKHITTGAIVAGVGVAGGLVGDYLINNRTAFSGKGGAERRAARQERLVANNKAVQDLATRLEKVEQKLNEVEEQNNDNAERIKELHKQARELKDQIEDKISETAKDLEVSEDEIDPDIKDVIKDVFCNTSGYYTCTSGTKMVFAGDMLFEFNKADLTDSAQSALKDFVTKINAVQSKTENKAVIGLFIGGHADVIGSFAANIRMSGRRAESVQEYLLKTNVSNVLMSTMGFGSTRATNQNAKTPAEGANDRRVEIIIFADKLDESGGGKGLKNVVGSLGGAGLINNDKKLPGASALVGDSNLLNRAKRLVEQ